jgi:hypothetical protein
LNSSIFSSKPARSNCFSMKYLSYYPILSRCWTEFQSKFIRLLIRSAWSIKSMICCPYSYSWKFTLLFGPWLIWLFIHLQGLPDFVCKTIDNARYSTVWSVFLESSPFEQLGLFCLFVCLFLEMDFDYQMECFSFIILKWNITDFNNLKTAFGAPLSRWLQLGTVTLCRGPLQVDWSCLLLLFAESCWALFW